MIAAGVTSLVAAGPLLADECVTHVKMTHDAPSPLVRDLKNVMSHADALAKALDEALVGTHGGLDFYCEGKLEYRREPDSSCDGAAVTLGYDGSIKYDKTAKPGTFCLAKSPDWGARAIVSVRASTQSERQASCFDATPGAVYRAPDGDASSFAVIKVWGNRTKDQLAALAKKALDAAKQVRLAYVKAWISERWAERLKAAAEARSTDEALYDDLDFAKFKDSIRPQTTAVGVTLDDPDLKDLLQSIAQAHPIEWPLPLEKRPLQHDEAALLCNYVNAVGSSPLPSNDDLAAALRALVLASQPALGQRLPFPLLTAQFPLTSDGVVEVTPAKGDEKIEGQFHGGQRLFVFGHDLKVATDDKHKGDSVAFFQGKKLAEESSEVAQVFAALIKFASGALGISLAGAGAAAINCATKTTEAEQAQCFVRQCEQRPPGSHLAPPTRTEIDGCYLEQIQSQPGIGRPRLQPLSDFLDQPPTATTPDDYVAALAQLAQVERTVAPLIKVTFLSGKFAEIMQRVESDWMHDKGFFGEALSSAAGDPVAPYTSIVVRSTALEEGYEYDARVCHDVDSCDGNTDAKSVTVTRSLEVRPYHAFVSTATEVSFALWKDGKLPMGGYSFQQVGGPGGPQLYYQLQANDHTETYASFAQLLVLYPVAIVSKWAHKYPHIFWQGLFIAGGPTVFSGSETIFLKQWNVRVGIEPVRKMLVTFGWSTRQIDVPAGRFGEGDIVAVDAGAKPPQFEQNPKWINMVSLGLAVDLSILGDLGKGIVGIFKNGSSDPAPSGGTTGSK